MIANGSNPPRLALWWLRHTYRGDQGEALAGDLIERFRAGATRGWFWKQVLIASLIGTLVQIRHRWAIFCYAAAGSVAMRYAALGTVSMSDTRIYAPLAISSWLHWSKFPWPLSQLVFELGTPALVTLTTLTVLAVGLLIQHSFRWTHVFRTWIISFALIAAGHFSIDLFPWLLRPIPGNPYGKVVIIPAVVRVLLLRSTFVVAAWLSCPITEPIGKPKGPATELESAR